MRVTRYPAGMSQLSPAQREALGAMLRAAPFAKVVRDLGERFARRDHELYLVGGTVRDALLDRASPDVDLTTDASPDQILAVVRARGWDDGVWLQGVRYGTVGVRKGDFRLEITTFRSDRYREDSRKPEVTFGRSVEDDPLRMLRAARFAAQLELVPTQETGAAIAEHRDRLQIVSRERIRDELQKLLLR